MSSPKIEKIKLARSAIVFQILERLADRMARGEKGEVIEMKGDINCPVCKKGKVRYDAAMYNGHIWAKCSTEDCVDWVE